MERRDDMASGRPGTYRTLCVRLCDGYYFPISGATSGSGLSRDADVCSASCGTEARLFYHPNAGGDVDTMVDLTGLAYSALPNAFRYRKTLVPECRCRPQPWSESELQRHRDYAAGKPVVAAPGTQTPWPARETPQSVGRRPAAHRPPRTRCPRSRLGALALCRRRFRPPRALQVHLAVRPLTGPHTPTRHSRAAASLGGHDAG